MNIGTSLGGREAFGGKENRTVSLKYGDQIPVITIRNFRIYTLQ
jgi:hypothetical protein